MTTMNGWPDAKASDVTRVVVGDDVDGCTVLKGDVATVLTEFMRRFHERVEPITTANGWRSRAFNTQVGGASGSNHISGTAVDLNGARHPYEAHQPGRAWSSGFTAAQTAELRRLLVEFAGVIRWGADFPRGKRDSMHFEIAVPPASGQVAALAKQLKPAAPAPTPAPPANTEENALMFIYVYGRNAYRLFSGGRVFGQTKAGYAALKKAGITEVVGYPVKDAEALEQLLVVKVVD